jgi:hypothetical protein
MADPTLPNKEEETRKVQNNAVGQNTGAAGGNAAQGGDSGGNQQLEAAFDQAIQQAQKTLEISTKKGAVLYALKQRPQ